MDLSELKDEPVINGTEYFFTKESFEKYSVLPSFRFQHVQLKNGNTNPSFSPKSKLTKGLLWKERFDLDKPHNTTQIKNDVISCASNLEVKGKDQDGLNAQTKLKTKKKKTKSKSKNSKEKFKKLARHEQYKKRIESTVPSPYHNLHPAGFEYLKQLFLNKLSYVQRYPRYYLNKDALPLISLDNIPPKFNFLKNVLTLGQIHRILIPKKKQNKLPINYANIIKRFPILQETEDNDVLKKQPVSRDSNAEYFAKKHSAHIVISSSALRTLAGSACLDDSNSWEIPIVVKEYILQSTGTRLKIAYVDKPFPRKHLSSRERSKKFYKSVTKCRFIHPNFKLKETKTRKTSNGTSNATADTATTLSESEELTKQKTCNAKNNQFPLNQIENLLPDHNETFNVQQVQSIQSNNSSNEEPSNSLKVQAISDSQSKLSDVQSESENDLVIDFQSDNDIITSSTQVALQQSSACNPLLSSSEKLRSNDSSENELVIEMRTSDDLKCTDTRIQQSQLQENQYSCQSDSDCPLIIDLPQSDPVGTRNLPIEKPLISISPEKKFDKSASNSLQYNCQSDSDCPLIIDIPQSNSEETGDALEEKRLISASSEKNFDRSNRNDAIIVEQNAEILDGDEVPEISCENVENKTSNRKQKPTKYVLPKPEKIMTRSQTAKLQLQKLNIDKSDNYDTIETDATEKVVDNVKCYSLRDVFGSSSSDEEMLTPKRKKRIIKKKIGNKVQKTGSAKNPLDEILALQEKLLGDGPKLNDKSSQVENNSVEDNHHFLNPLNGLNINYNLWKLGDITLLIRCSIDGQTIKNIKGETQTQHYTIIPKMEYQSDFGAEILTPSEQHQEWVTAFVRPKSEIMRVRIHPFTSKILAVEEVNLTDLQSVKFTACSLLYLVFSRLKRLAVGNYILRHHEKQAYCQLLENTEDGTKNGVYDLHKSYEKLQNGITSSSVIEWLPLDANVKFGYCSTKSF